jgi:hypothetical protein
MYAEPSIHFLSLFLEWLSDVSLIQHGSKSRLVGLKFNTHILEVAHGLSFGTPACGTEWQSVDFSLHLRFQYKGGGSLLAQSRTATNTKATSRKNDRGIEARRIYSYLLGYMLSGL